MKKNLKRRDYHKCEWSVKEYGFAVIKSAAVVAICSFFFYRSLIAFLPLSFLGVLYYRSLERRCIERDRQRLVSEFRECIMAVGTSLNAGYAVENAFVECGYDMKMLFGEKSLIYQELELIRRGLVINITLEELLVDMADRSCAPEIQQFANVFGIAKRSGGNMSEIISGSADIISRQIEVTQEIRTLLSGREMEQKIMKGMPFLIVLYIGMAYPGYFNSLYHNWQGVLIMTGCMAIYLTACIVSDRLLRQIAEELEK